MNFIRGYQLLIAFLSKLESTLLMKNIENPEVYNFLRLFGILDLEMNISENNI
jgi:hypothetical protein